MNSQKKLVLQVFALFTTCLLIPLFEDFTEFWNWHN